MRFLFLILVIFVAYGCGEGKPKTAEESAFESANEQITTGKDGAYYGNNAEAKEFARYFSENIERMQKLFFSGGKENRKISLTGEKFLTYCHANEGNVVFLVHVPQFKRYKDEVRDSLLELSWQVAELTLENYKKGQSVEIAIGLRGSLMYGGSAIGSRGNKPKYENSFSVEDEQFYKFFKQSAAAKPAKDPVPVKETSASEKE